ncbi:hypothetical protein O0I10_012258 [Lichtheimia ornata]|uniref:Uncharacterized protein n=1 Tax=Lichtheimia ornata TaxID=688661 RepID=A0AAD7URD2_9FUNG|nr:uncharacterized protein O0I10_012258 [Lichtheimia ornata]KAJ8652107.1 hypothetical protein O0I10_012258 [Lichtheimia ornata]
MDKAVIECRHVFVRMAIIVSCMSSGALGLLWIKLSLDVDIFSCVWLSLYVGYSASYLSSGALGFLWMQLSLRTTCRVPFAFLMDAAVIGCPQGFIHMAFIVCGIFSKLLVFWSFGIFMDADQRATSTASFSVSLPYYIVRWLSLLYHLVETSFYKRLQRQGNKFDTFWCRQVLSRLIVVLVVDNPSMDILLGMPVIGGSYQLQARSSNEQQSPHLYYDSFATVWSALSWPYQLHLRITALAVGS